MKKIIPRQYQQEAVTAALNEKENTIIVLSTGAGKSVVISELIKQSKAKKVLIFQPTAEILLQNKQHYENIIGEECSVLSASCNSHEIGNITFATIGTAINKVNEIKELGIDLILIDEAHRLVVEKKKSMYNRFLTQIRYSKQVIGLTATPYRNYNKWDNETHQTRKCLEVLTEIKKPDSFWKSICYNIDISYLIENDYLYKPEYVYNLTVDVSQLKLNRDGSDFTKESIKMFDETNLGEVYKTCQQAYKERNKIICFVETISAAQDLTNMLVENNYNAACISSQEESSHNEEVLEEFKNPNTEKMIIVNVNMLTEGYDAKECDAVVLGSPTASLMRYIQRAGRCLRPAGIKPPIIYDYAQSSKRFAKVEDILIIPSLEGYKICTRDNKELSGYLQAKEIEHHSSNGRNRNSFSYQNKEKAFDFIRFEKMTITYVDGVKTSKKGNKYLKISVFIEDIQEDAEFMIMEKHIFDSMDYSKGVKHSIKFNNSIHHVRCSFDSNSNFGFINDNVYLKK